ncbi:hypothetical protein CsSME_00044126 [Camellia sinensis var. sinensis]
MIMICQKRHGPPSAPLVAAAAPASMNNLQSKKTEPVQNQTSATTQWSVDTQGDLKGEETLDAGEDGSELGGEDEEARRQWRNRREPDGADLTSPSPERDDVVNSDLSIGAELIN